MLDPVIYEVLEEGIRALFIICLPIVAALSFSGVLVAALQSATSIHEPALGYGVRLVTLIALLYFFFPVISGYIIRLSELVYR